MAKINSRAKGARGEREFALFLNSVFPTLNARRGQQFKGGKDSPDVTDAIPCTHVEVKRVETLNIHKAMEQAIRDAGGATPYVAHRRSHGDWLLTIRAADIRLFAIAVFELIQGEDTPKLETAAA